MSSAAGCASDISVSSCSRKRLAIMPLRREEVGIVSQFPVRVLKTLWKLEFKHVDQME